MSHPPLPDSYEGLLLQARALQEAGQLPEAIGVYRRLVDRLARLSPKVLSRRPELQDLRKQALMEVVGPLRWERRLVEAMDMQRLLLELDPERANVWRRNLASLRVDSGDVEGGLAELRSLAEAAPDDAWNWVVLGGEARVEGRFTVSQSALERAVAAAGSTGDGDKVLATAHYERFRLFKEMARWEEAAAAWEQALALAPDDVLDTIPEVYKMLIDAGLYTLARTYVERDPNPLRLGFHRGLLDLMLGRQIDAVQKWRELAEIDPTSQEGGQDAWMEAVLRLHNPDPVLNRLDELLARHGTPRVLVLGGIAWAMRGDRDTARLYFERAIQLQRRERPPKQKLDGSDWRLLNSLVADAQIKNGLRIFFAVIETTWDRPEMTSPSGIVRP